MADLLDFFGTGNSDNAYDDAFDSFTAGSAQSNPAPDSGSSWLTGLGGSLGSLLTTGASIFGTVTSAQDDQTKARADLTLANAKARLTGYLPMILIAGAVILTGGLILLLMLRRR